MILSDSGVELLRELGTRARPKAGADVRELVDGGLAELKKETRSGTTWYELTPKGRLVLAGVVRR